MSPPLAIQLDSVVKDYRTPAGRVRAVDGVDLQVEAASSLAIVGPSGCGKSTLLGLIGGLETPTKGKVLVGGQPISSLPERARARLRREVFGFLFQSHDLLPFLTAAENVVMQQALTGLRDGNERCQQLLEWLELTEHANKLPDQLSGGQRQRVALARALMHRPRVILADEPTGELDSHSSQAVINLLLAAQRDLEATLVVVTHDPKVAEQMDRVLALADGQIRRGRSRRRRSV
jgi:putative ABC transport system ATP-binding protein